MVAHAFNPSTREAEAGGSLGVRRQPGLQELVPGQATKATEKPCLKKTKKKLYMCTYVYLHADRIPTHIKTI